MNARFLRFLSAGFGAALVALGAVAADPPGGEPGVFDQQAVVRPADQPAGQAGVQPQARGPVHEAFAEPTADQPKPGPVVARKPPEAVEELPPAEKPEGDDVQWIAGYWSWDEERGDFGWVTGIWRAVPPGRQWVPGHWTQVQGGYQWAPGFWAPSDGSELQVVPAPPDPQPETPPADLPADSGPAPDAANAGGTAAAPVAPAAPNAGGTPTAPAVTTNADSTFVPGHYVYQANKFVWQPGFLLANRSGFIWVPAHYVWTPAGYVFVDGYWDYDLRHRGLLFAPVLIDPQVLAQADWVYTPAYVVHDVCLLDALFIHDGAYYFGDYFDPGYAGLGYVSWWEHRHHRFGFDPLFGYYRWLHRGDRTWETTLKARYAARTRVPSARPPRTLALQQALGRNLLARNAGRAAFQNSILLGPVNKVDRNVVKMQTLDRAGQVRQRNITRQQRAVSQRREQAENRLLAQGQSALRKGGTAQALPLSLPRASAVTKPGPGRTPPPPPPGKANGAATGNRVGTGNAQANPLGGKVNTNAGNVPVTPGAGKPTPNAGTPVRTPGDTKINGNPGNGPGNLGGSAVKPRLENVTNGQPGNGGKVNGNVPVPIGNGGPAKPAGNPPPPPGGGNNGGRPGSGRVERTERLPDGPGRNNGTPNLEAARLPSGQNAQAVERVQSFTPPANPRLNNPAPVRLASTPTPRPSPGGAGGFRPAGGGGGRRR